MRPNDLIPDTLLSFPYCEWFSLAQEVAYACISLWEYRKREQFLKAMPIYNYVQEKCLQLDCMHKGVPG